MASESRRRPRTCHVVKPAEITAASDPAIVHSAATTGLYLATPLIQIPDISPVTVQAIRNWLDGSGFMTVQPAPSRCAVSLKPRTIQRSPVSTMREIEVFSAPRKANGRDPLASASAWPITPPWVNAATRCPG